MSWQTVLLTVGGALGLVAALLVVILTALLLYVFVKFRNDVSR